MEEENVMNGIEWASFPPFLVQGSKLPSVVCGIKLCKIPTAIKVTEEEIERIIAENGLEEKMPEDVKAWRMHIAEEKSINTAIPPLREKEILFSVDRHDNKDAIREAAEKAREFMADGVRVTLNYNLDKRCYEGVKQNFTAEPISEEGLKPSSDN